VLSQFDDMRLSSLPSRLETVTAAMLCAVGINGPFALTYCCLNLNSVNQLIFVMVKCSVVFVVRTGFLNNI
jgi:hypothetical protein